MGEFIIQIIRIIRHLRTYEAGGRKKLNGNKSNRAVVWLANSAHRFLMVCHSTFLYESSRRGGHFEQSLVLHLLEVFAYETTTLGPTEIVNIFTPMSASYKAA